MRSMQKHTDQTQDRAAKKGAAETLGKEAARMEGFSKP
jgi:hypothetical protein